MVELFTSLCETGQSSVKAKWSQFNSLVGPDVLQDIMLIVSNKVPV